MATTCIYCKAKLPKGAKFCPECGEKPFQEEESKPKMFDPILKLAEAANLLKVSKSMFYLMLAERNDPIPYFSVGKDKRFITTEILAWARGRQIHGHENSGEDDAASLIAN